MENLSDNMSLLANRDEELKEKIATLLKTNVGARPIVSAFGSVVTAPSGEPEAAQQV